MFSGIVTAGSSFGVVLAGFIASVVIIIVAARLGVYTAVSVLARTWKWRGETVGKTLGYVTSVPELITTIYLVLAGLHVSALYNILSSNISNLILIGLIVGFVFRRKSLSYIRTVPYSVLTVTLLAPAVLLLSPAHINQPWLTVFVLTVLYAGYVYYTRVKERSTATGPIEHVVLTDSVVRNHVYVKTFAALLLGVVGVGMIVLAGDVFSTTSQLLTDGFGVSEVLIGAITGVTTSLPELTTFYASANAHKRNPKVAFKELNHNLLASNASNIYVGYSVALLVLLIVSVG